MILARCKLAVIANLQQMPRTTSTKLEIVARNSIRLGLMAMLSPLLMSCASMPASTGTMNTRYFDRAGIDVVLAPGDVQTNYFKDTGSRERYCRSPQSDVASTFNEGFSLGLGLPLGTQKSIGEDVSRGAMSLGGRNPGVLIARELLYRACELSLNLNADTALSLRIYERFLQSLEAVVKTQVGTGASPIASAGMDPRIAPLTVPTPPTSPDVPPPLGTPSAVPSNGSAAPATPPGSGNN